MPEPTRTRENSRVMRAMVGTSTRFLCEIGGRYYLYQHFRTTASTNRPKRAGAVHSYQTGAARARFGSPLLAISRRTNDGDPHQRAPIQAERKPAVAIYVDRRRGTERARPFPGALSQHPTASPVASAPGVVSVKITPGADATKLADGC